MEVRIYAEDPTKGFTPDSGLVTQISHPTENASFRFETGIRPGDLVSTFYDPMIAKVVIHGSDRQSAINKLQETLANLQIVGVSTNTLFVRSLLKSDKFLSGAMNANYIDQQYQQFLPKPSPLEHVCALMAAKLITDSRVSMWSGIDGLESSFKTLSINGNDVSIRLQSDRLIINGKSFNFKMLSDEQYMSVQLDNQLVKGSITSPTPSSYMVFIDGIKYAVYKAEPSKPNNKSSNQKEHTIKSHMPSRIMTVCVKPGDTVSVGTKLLVTETMKMEHVVKSQVEGVVERVYCRPGQTVNSGVVLIELKSTL